MSKKKKKAPGAEKVKKPAVPQEANKMPPLSDKKCLVWDDDIYSNGFVCPGCGTVLFDKEKGVPTMPHFGPEIFCLVCRRHAATIAPLDVNGRPVLFKYPGPTEDKKGTDENGMKLIERVLAEKEDS